MCSLDSKDCQRVHLQEKVCQDQDECHALTKIFQRIFGQETCSRFEKKSSCSHHSIQLEVIHSTKKVCSNQGNCCWSSDQNQRILGSKEIPINSARIFCDCHSKILEGMEGQEGLEAQVTTNYSGSVYSQEILCS